MRDKMRIKSSKFHIIIEKEDKHNHKVLTHDDIIDVVRSLGDYYLILHEEDYKIEDGNMILKHPHYHLILQMHTPKEVGTILLNLAQGLKVQNYLISISVATDVLENIRYLVHADHPEKTRYQWEDIHTSNNGFVKEAKAYICSITTSMLIDVINRCDTQTEIMTILGITNFKKYQSVISMLWKEKYGEETAKYNALVKVRENMFNRIITNLRKYGMENHIKDMTDLLEKEVCKQMREELYKW